MIDNYAREALNCEASKLSKKLQSEIFELPGDLERLRHGVLLAQVKYEELIFNYVVTALRKSHSELLSYFDRHGWIYTGLHFRSDLINAFISMTFSPDTDKPDEAGRKYVEQEHNFTTFLWPKHDITLRDYLREPLEIRIEVEQRELREELERLQQIAEEAISIESHNGKDEFVVSPTPVRSNAPRSICIPYAVRSLMRSQADLNSAMFKQEHGIFLKQVYYYLFQVYLQRLPESKVYKINPEECFNMVYNTLRLHVNAGRELGRTIDPRAVIFYPVVYRGLRIGVLCFVMANFLGDEQRNSLQLISDYVLTNLYFVDQEMGIIARRIERQRRRITLRLNYDLFDPIVWTVHELELAISDIDEGNKSKAIDRLRECRRELSRVAQYATRLAQETLGPFELKTLMKGVLESLPARFGAKVKVQDDNLLPDLQIYGIKGDLEFALDEIIDNALEICSEKNRDASIWVDISFQVNRNDQKVQIVIKDYGGGADSYWEERMRYAIERYELIPSRKGSFGEGLAISAYLIREKFKGSIDFVNKLKGGITFMIDLPLVSDGGE